MKELREEIGMKNHPKMNVARSRMRCAEHVQRMAEDRLSKRAWKAEEGGRRRRGRPKLRSGKDRYELPRVEDHHRRQRNLENINNESRRSNQVTLTSTPQGKKKKKISFII